MYNTGPSISDSFGTGVGLSVAGPIAGAVFSLNKGGKDSLFMPLDLLVWIGLEDSWLWGLKFRFG